MTKVRLSSEDLRRTNKLLSEIDCWESVSRVATPGMDGMCGVVCAVNSPLAGGKTAREHVVIIGSVDPVDLAAKMYEVDGDLNAGLGEIIGRHLRVMAAEAILYLKGKLPVEIVDEPGPEPVVPVSI